MSDKAINPKEVESHNTEKSAWLIVDGGVYDVTEFLPGKLWQSCATVEAILPDVKDEEDIEMDLITDHPGGKKVLLKACGKDSSEQFWQFHSKRILTKTAAPMKIGVVGGSAKL